jgi:hypothetical protein
MDEKKWMLSFPQKISILKIFLNLYQKRKLELPEIPESNLYQLVKEFIGNVQEIV